MSSLQMKNMKVYENDFGSVDSVDRLCAMIRQEDRSYSIATNSCMDESSVIDSACHRAMFSWCYTVADAFGAPRENVYIAQSYCRRFLASSAGRRFQHSRFLYQLATLTSLHMAIKLHHVKQFDLFQLVEISGNRYTSDQFESTELLILEALEWKMNPPTPSAFVREMINLVPAGTDAVAGGYLLNLATYQTELAVLDDGLMNQGASSIAFAAVVNAIAEVDRRILPFDSKQSIFGTLAKVGITESNDQVASAKRKMKMMLAESKPVYQSTTAKRTRVQRPTLKRRESVGGRSPVCVSSSQLSS